MATFPQIFLEAGFTPSAPVGAAGTLILDDPALGKLDTGLAGDATSWTDITSFMRSVTVARPSTRVQGPLVTYQPGTLSAVLRNGDGRFDADNAAGPYAGAVHAMIPVRLRAVWNGTEYFLFSGFADAWQDDGANYGGRYAQVTLTATDAMKVLQGITLAAAAAAGAGELSGARVTRILNAAGWYADHRRVGAGNSAVQATTLGDTALSLLQLTADTEIGELYIDGAGNVVFRGRQAILTDARSATPQGVFGDVPGTAEAAGAELAYTAPARANDDTTLANDVQVTAVGGTLQEATDAASVARYLFARTYSRSDVILTSDAEALSYAQWVLYVSRSSESRFESLAVSPRRDPASLFPQVLGRETGDRIQVWRRPPGVTSAVSMLTADDGRFATGTGTWAAIFGSSSLARVTAPPVAVPGPGYAMSFTASFASSCAQQTGLYPCAPGAAVAYSASFLADAGTGPQSCNVGLSWCAADGSFLSSAPAAVVTDGTAAWSAASGLAVAPAGAAFFQVVTGALTTAAGQRHYVSVVAASGPVIRDCFIRGIQHDVDATAQTWLTTWTLQDASRYASFLVLDQPAAGALGSNGLAY